MLKVLLNSNQSINRPRLRKSCSAGLVSFIYLCMCNAVLMETMKASDTGKLSIRSDQLLDLTASFNFLSSSSTSTSAPVKASVINGETSVATGNDDQHQLSELQPLCLSYNDLPGVAVQSLSFPPPTRHSFFLVYYF